MQLDSKLLRLLSIVVETYIDRGEPIGSKFLHALDHVELAPSTLRKYLNHMEQEGLLYQPYSSAGRVPTAHGLETYVQNLLVTKSYTKKRFALDMARTSIKSVVETMGEYVDGVVVGFLQNDEYYYLGINNLLRQDLLQDYYIIQDIVQYIEQKQIISIFSNKLLQNNTIGYQFITGRESTYQGMMSVLFVKVSFGTYDGIVAILGPVRVNYRTNLALLKQFLDEHLL